MYLFIGQPFKVDLITQATVFTMGRFLNGNAHLTTFEIEQKEQLIILRRLNVEQVTILQALQSSD